MLKIEKNRHTNVMKENSRSKRRLYELILGVVAGILNGFFGGGGGTVVVVMLIAILHKNPRVAHATAILIILPLCVVSAFIYSVFGNFDLNVGVGATIGVIIGGVIGSFLLRKISPKWLSIVFSVVMSVAGAKMLFF